MHVNANTQTPDGVKAWLSLVVNGYFQFQLQFSATAPEGEDFPFNLTANATAVELRMS